MECTISVPTTINEESSRHNSLVPPVKPTSSSSINAITEADESHIGNQGENHLTEAHAKRHPACLNHSVDDSNSSESYCRDIALNVLNSDNYDALMPPATIV